MRKYKDMYGDVIVLCDKDLYGKVFEEGDKILNINEFFKGEERENVSKEEIESSYFVYAVGRESINILKKYNFIEESDVKTIKGIPYVFLMFL
ncbi:MAG: DUF424 family protein [Nanopusillaceae archaeon]